MTNHNVVYALTLEVFNIPFCSMCNPISSTSVKTYFSCIYLTNKNAILRLTCGLRLSTHAYLVFLLPRILFTFSSMNMILVSGEDLIAPCHCKGTQKYVHRSCLDNWRSTKVSFPSLRVCFSVLNSHFSWVMDCGINCYT